MFKIDVEFNVIQMTFRNVQYMTLVEILFTQLGKEIQQEVRFETLCV